MRELYEETNEDPDLAPEQKEYILRLRAMMKEAPDGLDVAGVVDFGKGFYVFGGCCMPCAHAVIHTAADTIPDPRPANPVEVTLITVQ